MNKEKRQWLIKQTILEHPVENQEQLAALLEKRGITVSQSTISRDIKDMYLVKQPGENGKLVYTTNASLSVNPSKILKDKISDVVLHVHRTDNLIIIKTMPGNAHAIGVLLDKLGSPEMLGCICGNDTCLVISQSPEAAQSFCNHLC
ncbi:arginine repressor [Bacillus haynesii]|uniref:Arginine repressor n=1 Tax=Bacillus haynesii TaxID=1925021 RepID=A0AA90EW47_9BACI|nr:arginine repressor [Bacillus haynesii]MCY7752144.1 arginine repressor [Bacillus haynesii]MCY7789701.1 arginine repressor [Bacillus haynesii]MCY7862195.1 arginine repressor [Bacillus haynesii]MCY8002222.1 arginine repressor [Bacillus haynesii]MCY8046129.1 arginine repressor [Bacillus haynesii]